MDKIIIFLGPSLAPAEAKRILPTAYYLPPARCGDITRILRLKPALIGIIDGYFENTAAIWHKEILCALEQGIQVVGGSSMGALRASELTSFGMQVVGKIATGYLTGVINDDDEVAVLHGLADADYAPITDATVNIRATLEYAVAAKMIDNPLAKLLLAAAQQLFYQERTLAKAIATVANTTDSPQLIKLTWWLEQGGYINAKQEDAKLVLQTISKQTNSGAAVKPPSITAHKPAFFRSLRKNMLCRPLAYYCEWLPISEKVALAARYLGSTYRLTRRLAYLLASCYELAVEKNIQPTVTLDELAANPPHLAVLQVIKNPSWDEKADCPATEKTAFSLRLAKIGALITQEQQLTDLPNTPRDYLLILIRLAGDYVTYKQMASATSPSAGLQKMQAQLIVLFKEKNPLRFQVMQCMAECWWLIERQALRLGLQPTPQTLQEYSNHLRLTHKLHTPQSTRQWLADNDLDWNAYQHMVAANARLSSLVIQNNGDLLIRNPNHNEAIWWLLDALWLTGVYAEAKALLHYPDKLEQLKLAAKKEKGDLESYALSLDFIGGEHDFMTGLQPPEKTVPPAMFVSTTD